MTNNIDIKFKLDDENLKKALAELGKNISVKIGILGADGSKKIMNDKKKIGKITMATLGAIHEFGSPKVNIPARSFIQMPLERKFKEELGKNVSFKNAVKELNIDKMNQEAGESALASILDAFESGGFGQWATLKPKTVKKKTKNGKKGDSILIDTGDLRRSISYEVI